MMPESPVWPLSPILAANHRSPGQGSTDQSYQYRCKTGTNLWVNMREAEFYICGSLLHCTALEEDRASGGIASKLRIAVTVVAVTTILSSHGHLGACVRLRFDPLRNARSKRLQQRSAASGSIHPQRETR